MDERRILAGRYELGETIGRGGMAEVHIGHDRRLGRTVAVKVLRSDLARDPSFLNRFRREAQAAAALNHPTIVAVYDTGEEQVFEPSGGVAHVPYIVMEYVEGHTVREVLRDGRPLPPDETIEIVGGVLSALEYSHRAGIVHRDIKPANVMLTTSGAVKVMDFGIARAVADSQATVTQASAVVGTAQYLSPEQARGEQVDARSDLYSTGCLLFELLTGRPPFMADSMVAVAYQHVREEAPRPSTLNPTLHPAVADAMDRIVHKALAKDRETRYQSAAEFRADLEALLRGGRVMAPAIGAMAAPGQRAPSQQTTAMMDPVRSTTSAPRAGASPWQSTGSPWGNPVMDDDEPDYDDEPDPRRWWIPVAIGVGVLAVLLLVLVFVFNNNGGTTTVAVPNVIGMAAEEAKAELEDKGFTTEAKEGYHDQVAAGLVFDTDPKPNNQARKGSKVTYMVSLGPQSEGVSVPDLKGKTVAEATTALEALELKVGDVKTQDDGLVPKDQIISTDPPAGQFAQPGDAITLYVSTGWVTVPDLTGMTRDEASRQLQDRGLVPEFTQQDSPGARPGTVVSTTPAPNTRVTQRSVVTVAIASEEKITVPAAALLTGPGRTYETTVERLKQEGFTGEMKKVSVASAFPVGQVISVTPAPGTQAAANATFTITVSAGNEPPDP